MIADPALVITGSRHRGYSRSQAIMQHPVIEEVARFGTHRGLFNREWVCGTPRVLAAVERIGALRGDLVGAR